MHVRPGTLNDLELIGQLIRELADYEKLLDQCVFTLEDLGEELFGGHPTAEVLIGELDGVPAGFALYFHNFSTFLGRKGIYLEDLFVRPAARGRGLGKALLRALARIALERKCGRVEWSVLDWNTPSIQFYEALGARPQSEWSVYRLTGEALSALAR